MSKYELYFSLRSPYARKVRILLDELKIDYVPNIVDVHNPPSWFYSVNPLGRVPTLKTENGTYLMESSQIIDHLFNRYSDAKVFAGLHRSSDRTRRISALANGIVEVSISAVLEGFRHASLQDASVVREARVNTFRALQTLESEVLDIDLDANMFGILQIEIAAMLGYIEFRFGKDFLNHCPRLSEFLNLCRNRESFSKSVPV